MLVFAVHCGSIHPTQKPVRLAERIIALISDPGDIVLDPFMGIGATAVARVNLRRRFIRIELEEKYFDVARKRIERAVSRGQFDFTEGSKE